MQGHSQSLRTILSSITACTSLVSALTCTGTMNPRSVMMHGVRVSLVIWCMVNLSCMYLNRALPELQTTVNVEDLLTLLNLPVCLYNQLKGEDI